MNEPKKKRGRKFLDIPTVPVSFRVRVEDRDVIKAKIKQLIKQHYDNAFTPS